MHAKPYTKKEFEKLFINNGFSLQRVKGSHFIYKNGTDLISVPKNLNKEQKELLKSFEDATNESNYKKRKSFLDKIKDLFD